nr:hypothetical protein [uncultured Ruminococcus sp.]
MNSSSNELAPFKNLFNEWFARDTSKKIRAVIKSKAERGKRIGSHIPYGYKKDPDSCMKITHLVKFQMTSTGYYPTVILLNCTS